ncbi:LAFA_0F03686g1_1 [Lachancea sp. 'fantastica']|nr:LAFA_0F03686g1_1 [Lachancea sp. 'fantastica']
MVDDAVTFIGSPERSFLGTSRGETAEFNDDTVVSLPLPLVVRSSAPVVPPLRFIKTIKDASVRQNHNLSLLLWILNSSPKVLDLTLDIRQCPAPFQLFKTCFENSCNAPNYESFLSVQTLTNHSLAFKTGKAQYEISVFPQILQSTRMDQFKTEQLLQQYTQQFARILDAYKDRSHPNSAIYLGANLSRLIQCYVNDTIYDIVYKWRHWNRILGHHVEFAPFSQLVTKFWDSYLVFHVGGSLSQFEVKMRHFGSFHCDSSKRNLRSNKSGNTTVKYGIWIDNIQGVILLSNMITTELMDAVPSLTLDLMVTECDESVKKLLLFINCCLIECVNQEMTKTV